MGDLTRICAYLCGWAGETLDKRQADLYTRENESCDMRHLDMGSVDNCNLSLVANDTLVRFCLGDFPRSCNTILDLNLKIFNYLFAKVDKEIYFVAMQFCVMAKSFRTYKNL